MLRKILIVDDCEKSRLLLVEILRDDYDILTAAGGQEALELLESFAEDISAVVLDLGLEEIDGYQVLSYIRNNKSLAETPVLVITDDSDRVTENRALSLGASDFVTKPYSPEVIRRRCRNAIDLHSAIARIESIIANVNSSVSAVSIDDAGVVHFVFANERYYSLLGYTKAQFEAEVSDAFELLHPEDREPISRLAAEVLRSGQSNSYEYRCYKRDGSLIWLRCDASRTHIAGVEEAVLLSVITDITSQVETEQRLVASSERLQAIVSNIASGVTAVIIHDDGQVEYVFVTDKYYQLLGYTQEQYAAEVTDAFSPILREDIEAVMDKVLEVNRTGQTATLEFRAWRRDGSLIWLQDVISLIRFADTEQPVQLSVFTDITERKEAEEKLRLSEEQFRVAASIGGRTIGRYDIKSGDYFHDASPLLALGFAPRVENAPQTFVESGHVAPESVADFLAFFANIGRGDPSASTDALLRTDTGDFRWFRIEATGIADTDGRPSQAIIVFSDITESIKKEAVYRKWQQSLQQKPLDSYSLYRYNLNKNTSYDSVVGSLLTFVSHPSVTTFNARTVEYAEQFVHPEDREAYQALLNSDTLLANFYRDQRLETMEYREMLPDGGLRWIRLTVELVEYPNSSDVEAYLMYEDIDASKQAELQAKVLAETDPLTGVLNRIAFARKTNQIIKDNPASRLTLMMLDIDGFKLLNDSFGHAVGDQALIDIANSLRSILRHNDLLGRLGGDEFLICLRDVPYDAVIQKKASQICSLVRKSFSMDVRITASVGIAVYPQDGDDFATLYRRADAALYQVKETGRDNFAYFDEQTAVQLAPDPEPGVPEAQSIVSTASKRRMLIVDDSDVNRRILAKIFENEFIIDTANDGATALIRLRHYGAGISILLLDLVMPGMDGFAVLEKMQSSVEMRTIPVVVVSGQDDRDTSLQAIRCGAADFVTKPVDPDLIRLRVQSAISRAENERLRAQNSYLLLQSSEEAKYRTVLDSTGTVVIEYDWVNGVFTYDSSITRHMAGKYDSRKLWRILLSDMVADSKEVRAMQELVHSIADDRKRDSGSLVVRMSTPEGERQWFRMSVFKRKNEFQLTDKMILTFININEEVLAAEKLRFQAERDTLTGIYNRHTFLGKVEETVGKKPANSYIMIAGDVNRFKMVNDRFGHGEGDKLLQFIANTLQTEAAAVHGLCGRLGNDNFAALIPNTPRAIERINHFPKGMLADYPLGMELVVALAAYIIDDPSLPAAIMLDRAAIAKQTIKGKYESTIAWYDETMRQKLLMEQEIANTMEAALRDELFEIYLQPQFDHTSGRICGAEALVRWVHPDKGVLFFPNDFIPLFERSGFITRMDEFVWERTAQLLHSWLSSGRNIVPVSVNVSRLDTHDPLLCEKLLALLEKYHIPIELFRLEITESLFEENSEKLIAAVDKLHQAGFIIEMDDFGSGYSSLNVLKDVPVDLLKLDMRFFSETGNMERSGMILNAVMRMARWLNLQVIAEGVETRAQADYLTSIGCPIVQGYLYARPMAIARFERMLAENAAAPEQHGAEQLQYIPDVKDIWAVESAESQLFYNYMDAAVIFEYRQGNYETLRVNKRFLALLRLDVNTLLFGGGFPFMHNEDIPLFCAATERAAETGRDEIVRVRRVFVDSDRVMEFSCKLRPLPKDGDRAIILCTVTEVISRAT